MTIELGNGAIGMDGPLEWIGTVGTICAAGLVAADLGRRVTGFGFLLFCAVSIVWVVSGLTHTGTPIAVQNGILLLINAYGVWQYLLSAKNRKVMERIEPVAARIEKQVEAEEGA